MRRIVFGCAFAAATVIWTQPRAHAATQTVSPIADAFVAASQPDNNFGISGGLEVSAPGSPAGEFQVVMRFDPAAARGAFDAEFGAGNWSVTGASLRLGTSPPNNAFFNPNVAGPVSVRWMQNDTWLEGSGSPGAPTTDGVTFNTLPTFLSTNDEPLGTFQFPGGNSGTNTYALSPSSGFGADVLAGNLVSLHVTAGPGTSYLFGSRSAPNDANRTVLTIQAIPEPSGALSIAVAAACLLARRVPVPSPSASS